MSMEFFPCTCGRLLIWRILIEFKIVFSIQSSNIDQNFTCMSVNFRISGQIHYPVNIHLFKFNNRNTRKGVKYVQVKSKNSKPTSLASLNIFFTPFSMDSIVELKHIFVGWVCTESI